VNLEIKDMVEKYRKKKHDNTDTTERYMADGIEAMKMYDLPKALEAFDTALDRNNQVRSACLLVLVIGLCIQ